MSSAEVKVRFPKLTLLYESFLTGLIVNLLK